MTDNIADRQRHLAFRRRLRGSCTVYPHQVLEYGTGVDTELYHMELGRTIIFALIHPLRFLLSQGSKEDIVELSVRPLWERMLQLFISIKSCFLRPLLRRQSIRVLPFRES